MKAYLFLGDTHNDLDFAESAAKLARRHGAEIVQLGDWGFLWPGNDQLDQLSDMLVGLGVTMRFVDGNHDDHPRLKKLRGRARRHGVAIAENVIYQPRGSTYGDEDGTRFLFLGGAPSIDRNSRQLNDAISGGTSWWPEEVISEADLELALSVKIPIHALVTHDAPTFPPGFSPKGSPSYQRDQLRSMKIVDKLIRRHRPTVHVHGHWHARYTRRHENGTIIAGLSCNEIDPTYLDEATLLWSRTPAQGARMSHPPITNGTRVKATMLRSGKGDYTQEAAEARTRHSGKTGTVYEHHDSHGLCYGVKFEDGTAFFDPEELEILP